MSLDADTIFSPDGADAFLQGALGRRALYLEGNRDRFRDLASWAALNRLMVYGGLGYPRLRVISGDREVPEVQYSRRGRNGYPRLLVAELTALLRDGAMLAVDAVEQLHEPISEICGTLEKLLCVQVQAELYASWRDRPARSPHWDDHETLLLQIEGRKSWSLFHPTAYYPVGNRNLAEPGDGPAWQGTLLPGHLLYIPRGWWYRDSEEGEPALYLAITFTNPRGTDMARRIFEMAADKDLMRMDIPRFRGSDAQGSFLTYVQHELSHLAARPGLFLGLLKDMQESSEPRVEFNLPWSAAPEPLPPSEDYFVIPLLRFPNISTIERRLGTDRLGVFHNGRVVSFGSEVFKIFELLCSPLPLTVRRLVEECRNEIPPGRALAHLSELIRGGLVTAREADKCIGPSGGGDVG